MSPKKVDNTPILSYATNESSAGDVFYQRQKYRDFVYPTLGNLYHFNFWHEDKFYGRVNPGGFPGVVAEDSLKQLSQTSGETLFSANFAADAWRDFTDKMRQLRQAGILSRGGVWSDPKAKKSWRCAYDSYHDYMVSKVYPAFADIYMDSHKAKAKLLDLKTFLGAFSTFAQQVVKEGGPMTFSGFLESPYCSVLNTGLAIEISDDDHGTDLPKTQKFLYDQNYEIAMSIASQHGFGPDKNAPWRLVADVDNPAMQEYMVGVFMYRDPTDPRDGEGPCEEPLIRDPDIAEPYGFSSIPGFENVIRHAYGYPQYAPLLRSILDPAEILFNGSYNIAWENDLNILRLYLLDFYNRYVEDNPYSHNVLPPRPGCKLSNIQVTQRLLAEESMFRGPNAPYGDKWALKATYNLRSLERGIQKTRAKRSQDIRDFMNVYYLSPGSAEEKYYQALRYLNVNLFKGLTTQNLTQTVLGGINRYS